MRPPIFVRPLTDAERHAIEQRLALRRRLRVAPVPDSARQCAGRAPRIAAQLGCDDQTVLDAAHAFIADGLARLVKGSSRPKRTRLAFGPDQAGRLRALLHRGPHDFGHPTGVWTLALAAEVSLAQGLVAERVSGEAIRKTLLCLGIGCKRAKRWITGPDPAYAREKKGGATA